MVRIKICGLIEVKDALAACQAGVDFIGLVFAASKRQISSETALKIVTLLEKMPVRPEIVGVFANQGVQEVNRIAEEFRLDRVQLSGNETSIYCDQITQPIIKVIHVSERMTARDILEEIGNNYSLRMKNKTQFLLDSEMTEKHGGTGKVFNWNVASEVSRKLPVIVAGGLDPDNVVKLIQQVHPWGVDVSSGVETGGIKDINKIKAFIRAVKEDGRK